MIRTASLYFPSSNPRQKMVKEAVMNGLGQLRITTRNGRGGDIGISWGLSPDAVKHMEYHHERNQSFIVFDLGYWNRQKPATARNGCYKISLNGHHPTEYMCDSTNTRIPKINQWRYGGDWILVAGMGPKGCKLYGYKHGEWDQYIINEIRKKTDLPIYYRPKPSDKQPATPSGAKIVTDKDMRLMHAIAGSRCVVTHHGNTTLEALAYGKPIFCVDGPATLMSSNAIPNFDNPVLPKGRKEFFSSLADFNPRYEDIVSGDIFRYLMKRDLI